MRDHGPLMRTAQHPFAGLTLPHLIDLQGQALGGKAFLTFVPLSGAIREWTFASFARDVRVTAAGLARRGVVAGDTVLIHMDNCPEHLIAYYACARLGAVAVTTNTKCALPELSYFSSHSTPVGVITQPKYVAEVNATCRSAGWMLVTETDAGEPPVMSTDIPASSRFEELLASQEQHPVCAARPELPVSIIYTSGTTARPKGVVWTHANAAWGARVSATHQDLFCSDRYLVTMPLFHCNAQSYSVAACLWAGASVVLQPRFSASRFWEVSMSQRCTWTSIIPLARRLVAEQNIPDHHYRLWGSASSAPDSDERVRVKTVGWWGMTETITQGLMGLTRLPNRPGTVGRPVPEYEIAIVDENGQRCDVGTPGELRIAGTRGLSLFAGYLHDEEATRNAFDEHGFLCTGDLVVMHEDGTVAFVGRRKDMLKVGGENVAALEVEVTIVGVPGVRQVAVVPWPHRLLVEVPVAVVVRSQDRADSNAQLEDAILRTCRERLSSFKVPRRVVIVDEIPEAAIGKANKREVIRMLSSLGLPAELT
jgi:crotonobetaine/carnitine-CoA ligase